MAISSISIPKTTLKPAFAEFSSIYSKNGLFWAILGITLNI